MTTKRIFVPLCTQELDFSALEAGVVTARKFDAHLEGIYVQDSHAESVAFANSHLDPGQYTELVNRLRDQRQQNAIAAREAFEGQCQTKNLAIFQSPSGCWKS